MAITTTDGKKTILFDIHNITHQPDDPSPGGTSNFNPVKLYTSGVLSDLFKLKSGILKMYWDDLDFKFCRKLYPVEISSCAPLVN